jgi:hypothetical protein
MAQKQESTAMACPVCGQGLASNQVELHLRQRHQIFQFRGERRSLNDTLAHLLGLVLKPTPDREAWQTLQAIAREQHNTRGDAFLAASLASNLGRLDAAKREASLISLAGSMLGSGVNGVMSALAAEKESTARLLALTLAMRWPGPVPVALFAPLAPLLSDRQLPAAMQMNVAAALIRSLPAEKDPREQAVYEALAGKTGKVEGVQKLYKLQEQVGNRPLLRAVRERLEGQVRMRCPRCNLELRRAEMIDHLWSEHRLVLEGQKVRDPWSLIEDWLDEADGVLAPDQMSRCQTLAQQADPDNGVTRLQRMILQAGLRDPEAMKGLAATAKDRGASICPGCYALVPVPHPVPGRPLNRHHGRLSAKGYRVELTEDGFRTSLELQSPSGFLIHTREPGKRLALRGWLWMTAGPFLLLALVLAALPQLENPLWPVLGVLVVAFVAGISAYFKNRPTIPLKDRVVDHAWQMMVPQLQKQGWVAPDADFLAGLALVSLDHGHVEARRPFIDKALRFAASEAVQGRAVGPLAALRRLSVNDGMYEGRDPIPMVLDELAHCLVGRVPLAYGEALLTDWETDWWTAANLVRLKVLLCDRAFEAGFEVSDLVEIGQSYPALGAVLEVSSPRRLILLRLLWSLRATRPWDQASEAETVFELAKSPESARLLQLFPDLLLLHENSGYRAAHISRKEELEPLRIAICCRGVALQDVLFERKPPAIEISGQKARGGYEMRVGSETFRFSSEPTYIADRLERWFRYLFNEFLPGAGQVINWKSPDLGAKLRARGAYPCPECRKPLLPRVGALAKSLTD